MLNLPPTPYPQPLTPNPNPSPVPSPDPNPDQVMRMLAGLDEGAEYVLSTAALRRLPDFPQKMPNLLKKTPVEVRK